MENSSIKNEYLEIMEFIQEMQESALKQSDALLSEKKDLEYKKRQLTYVLQEKNKKAIPNISMFSPLNHEDITVDDLEYKNKMENITSQLIEIESKWEKQENICVSLNRLKKYFSDMKKEVSCSSVNNNNSIDYGLRLLQTQEMDRNRISRDLHDTTVQSLTSLGHKMEYCCKMIDRDSVKVKLELQSMIDLNKEIINDMRAIIYDLRPMSLNNIGLVATVEAYCLHLRRNDYMDVVFKVEGEERELSSILSITLYRVIQEACNNAIRHSKAKKVFLRISFLENCMEIDIEDNGIGFNINEVENRVKEDFLHGFGLSMMRERVKLLSGTFTINTQPGSGTKIHVYVPTSYTSRKEVSL